MKIWHGVLDHVKSQHIQRPKDHNYLRLTVKVCHWQMENNPDFIKVTALTQVSKLTGILFSVEWICPWKGNEPLSMQSNSRLFCLMHLMIVRLRMTIIYLWRGGVVKDFTMYFKRKDRMDVIIIIIIIIIITKWLWILTNKYHNKLNI